MRSRHTVARGPSAGAGSNPAHQLFNRHSANERNVMGNPELEKKTEKVARQMAKENGQPEELWELFLHEAYDKVIFNR